MSRGLQCGTEGCERLATYNSNTEKKGHDPHSLKIDGVPVCQTCYYGRFECVVNGCDKPAYKKAPVGYLCGVHNNQRHLYGMTPQEMSITDWMRSEGVLCPICQTNPVDSVDHSHAGEGRPRAALCGMCNRGLGHFNDDKDTLERAASLMEMDALAPGFMWTEQMAEAEGRMNGDQSSNEQTE